MFKSILSPKVSNKSIFIFWYLLFIHYRLDAFHFWFFIWLASTVSYTRSQNLVSCINIKMTLQPLESMVVSISASEFTVQAAASQVRVLATANDYYLCFSLNWHCLVYKCQKFFLKKFRTWIWQFSVQKYEKSVFKSILSPKVSNKSIFIFW